MTHLALCREHAWMARWGKPAQASVLSKAWATWHAIASKEQGPARHWQWKHLRQGWTMWTELMMTQRDWIRHWELQKMARGWVAIVRNLKVCHDPIVP